MKLLHGSFDTYRYPTELEAAPPSALDRIPLRPLLALSLLVALAIAAAAYLRHVAMKTPAQPAPVAASPSEARVDASPGQVTPTLPLDLQQDASEHAKAVERQLNQAVNDLSAAQSSLEKVRPYANSEVDEAAQRVESAHHSLDKARAQLKVVEAMISRK